MSALEAKAHGLPLLLSDAGGCHELIDNGNGILCNNTIDSIRQSLNLLITNMDEIQGSASTAAPNAWLEPAKMDYLHAYLGTKSDT